MSNSPAPTPPNDQTRFVPKPPGQIAAQAAEADRLLKEHVPAPAGTEPQPAQPSPQPTPPPAQQPPSEPTSRTYTENDMRAMQGRFEREAATNRELAERVTGLEALLAQLSTQPQPQQEGQPGVPFERRVTPELENEYGKDFLETVGKQALDVVTPELAGIKKDLEFLKGGMAVVGSNIQKSAEDRMYDMLDAEVPDWEAINESAPFHNWLAEMDPYSGRRRHDMIKEAFARHDGPRVVTFFKGFKAEAAAIDPQTPQGASYQTPGNGSANGKIPLESFAAPGRAGPAAQGRPADRPMYPRSYISAFYRDRTAGKWRGREAEAAAIDADIIAAGREGRVF